MSNETPNRVHAGGLFVPTDPIPPPFTSSIVNSQAVQSFTRVGVGQYVIALQNVLAFHEGYAEAHLPANFQATTGAQISEDGASVLITVLSLTGVPVDPPIVACTVWAVRQGEGEGPAIPFPTIPPPIGGGEFRLAFTIIDLSGGVLTVNHNLGVRYHSVTVYDGSENIVANPAPDLVTDVDANTVTIDLTTFTITGTWHVVVGG